MKFVVKFVMIYHSHLVMLGFFSDLSCIINIILLQEKKKFSVNVMQFYALIVRVAILVIRMMIVPQNTVLIQMMNNNE